MGEREIFMNLMLTPETPGAAPPLFMASGPPPSIPSPTAH